VKLEVWGRVPVSLSFMGRGTEGETELGDAR
jgi:hypothetical protein